MTLLSLVFFSALVADETPSVEGELTGQLGNQMFVVAATYGVALDNEAIPTFPDFLTRTVDNTALNFEKVFYRLNTTAIDTPSTYIEPSFHYTPIPYKKNMRLAGYFQSEKYFHNYKQAIIDLFSPSKEIMDHLKDRYKDLLIHPRKVSVHLRSYHKEDPNQKIYIQYGKQYIQKAMEQFPLDTLFVIFSNNIPFCKRQLAYIKRPMIFIEDDMYYNELYLMSLCDHHIISNSSFSWWGAYLNQNEEKIVISPPRWFNPRSRMNEQDLLPEGWIRLKL